MHEAEMPALPALLRAFPRDRLVRLQRNLRYAAQVLDGYSRGFHQTVVASLLRATHAHQTAPRP